MRDFNFLWNTIRALEKVRDADILLVQGTPIWPTKAGRFRAHPGQWKYTVWTKKKVTVWV